MTRIGASGRQDQRDSVRAAKSRRARALGRAAAQVAVGVRLAVALVAWACGGATPARTPSPAPGLPTPEAPAGPSEVVESFLEAAARRDLTRMARSFGTGDGPVAETGGAAGCALRRLGSWVGLAEACPRWADVELRMDLLAAVLDPAAYRVRGEEQVAGRERPTVRVLVDLSTGGREAPGVPFVVVLARNGSWLVQEIEVERLTR